MGSEAPAPTAFRGFVLVNGRYTNFDVAGATTKTVVGGSNDRGMIVGAYQADAILPDLRSARPSVAIEA